MKEKRTVFHVHIVKLAVCFLKTWRYCVNHWHQL